MAELTGVEWLPGHIVNGVLMKYYHMCPGQGCAIGNFLQRLADRRLVLNGDDQPQAKVDGSCE